MKNGRRFISVEQQMDDLDYRNLDVYERRLCYDEYLKYGDHTMVSFEVKESVIATWLSWSYKKQFEEYMEIKKQKEIYWTIGDDEEVITDNELSNHGYGNLIEETKIAEIFRIETDIFQFETSLCEAFKEFNYLLKIDVDVPTNDIPGFNTYDEYKYAWIYE
nr:hypothetical protein [Tanacetum cinerariifolium]